MRKRAEYTPDDRLQIACKSLRHLAVQGQLDEGPSSPHRDTQPWSIENFDTYVIREHQHGRLLDFLGKAGAAKRAGADITAIMQEFRQECSDPEKVLANGEILSSRYVADMIALLSHALKSIAEDSKDALEFLAAHPKTPPKDK